MTLSLGSTAMPLKGYQPMWIPRCASGFQEKSPPRLRASAVNIFFAES